MRAMARLRRARFASLVASLSAAAVSMTAVPVRAECPPGRSAFEALSPVRPAECAKDIAESSIFRMFERSFVFTDGSSIYFSQMGRKLAFSTRYSVGGQQISATTNIRDDFEKVAIPGGEKGPYAIVNDRSGDTLFLIGDLNDYQRPLASQAQGQTSPDWSIVAPRFNIERGHMWWLTDADARIKSHPDPGYRWSYPFLVPVYCKDFDFVVQLPGVARLALISSTRLTLLDNDTHFSFEAEMTPDPSFYETSRKLQEGSLVLDVRGDRVIGSVATAQEDGKLWLRLTDAPSEGDKGRVHYVALVQGADGALAWLRPGNRLDEAPWWCFE